MWKYFGQLTSLCSIRVSVRVTIRCLQITHWSFVDAILTICMSEGSIWIFWMCEYTLFALVGDWWLMATGNAFLTICRWNSNDGTQRNSTTNVIFFFKDCQNSRKLIPSRDAAFQDPLTDHRRPVCLSKKYLSPPSIQSIQARSAKPYRVFSSPAKLHIHTAPSILHRISSQSWFNTPPAVVV